MFGASFVTLLALSLPSADPPTVEVTADDTAIDRSCHVVIAPDRVIADANGDGVIHITTPGITVQFAPGAILRGAPSGAAPDSHSGYGIRIVGARGVTIRGARVAGFHAGIWATDADELGLEDCDGSGNRRARLYSTSAAEDGRDWLGPHRNDANEWLVNYGAAFYIEDSDGIVVRRCRVRRGQNGLCLDRVNDSRIYDNDFSFISGWGIALWRSSRNVVSRNALDFCVRGYSHGVYNRGQDSAGILCFEQCNENIFAENSATHGGDGFFGFAGREALGDDGEHPPEWYRRRGNNDNLLIDNDFSYAPAHGIEMTFSFGNRLLRNRLAENAICGIWGGYSQETLIAHNTLLGNGESGYGLERGGVNIEHGRANRVVFNEFRDNRCGVHFWWDPEGDFAEKSWGAANGTASTGNVVARNRFRGDAVVLHVRGPSSTRFGRNAIDGPGDILAEEQSEVLDVAEEIAEVPVPEVTIYGDARAVGARLELRGRGNIIMTEWGPWDHASPLVRLARDDGAIHVYELLSFDDDVVIDLQGSGLTGRRYRDDGGRLCYSVAGERGGVLPYTLSVTGSGERRELSGTILRAEWRARFFRWPADRDPREQEAAWRMLSRGEGAIELTLPRLRLRYGMGGPSTIGIADELDRAGFPNERFGMIATATIPLAAGKWRFKTLSDDGVRVSVGGRRIIDNWTHHGPTADEGVATITSAKPVEILVEHFEIDGYAWLEFELERAHEED